MEPLLFMRIKQLCAKNGISVSKLESELGFSTSTIQKWKSAIVPNANNVIKVARYFNVSTDYLLGIADVETTLIDFAQDDDIISLQRARSKMSSRDKQRMMDILKIGFDYAFNDADDDDENSSD